MTLRDALRALPPEEKRVIVTELWDDLATSAPLMLPAEELAEMQRRRDETFERQHWLPPEVLPDDLYSGYDGGSEGSP